MLKRVLPVVVVAGMLVAVAPVAAHHSWPVSYSRMVTVKGTVVSFTWSNPHPMIALDVRAESGAVEKWSVGGPAINRMEANGWSRTTLKAGDEITAMGYQFADGQKIVRLEKVIMPDGREMLLYGRR